MERALNLTLKKRWFEMILSGEKKEEYREFKPYWISRLCTGDHKGNKTFDVVVFKNGYAKKAPYMKVQCLDIVVGDPNFKWYGAKTDKQVFIICLGKILETKNIEQLNKG